MVQYVPGAIINEDGYRLEQIGVRLFYSPQKFVLDMSAEFTDLSLGLTTHSGFDDSPQIRLSIDATLDKLV